MQIFSYKFLAAYAIEHADGRSATGRVFFTNEKGMPTEARVKAWEEYLRGIERGEAVIVTSFQLLERRLVLFDRKPKAEPQEKEPGPRPYHRQLYSNGIWQCDLPGDNAEALRIILERFDACDGYVELEAVESLEALFSEGPEQRELFQAKAIEWLIRNPGRP